jgi:hypothetical protein
MTWMNQWEIEQAAQCPHACPNVRKGAHLLLRLMQAVNAQSDGWPYWHAPSRAAKKLMELVQSAGNLWHGTDGRVTAAALRKAVMPIRVMVTRQQKIQAEHGNTFKFDVDAALEESRELWDALP